MLSSRILRVFVLATVFGGFACAERSESPIDAHSAACDLVDPSQLTALYDAGVERVPDSAPASWSAEAVATCVFRRSGPVPVVVVVSLERVDENGAASRRIFIAATRAADASRELEDVDDLGVPAVWDATLQQLTTFPDGAVISIKPTETSTATRHEVARALMATAIERLVER